MAEILGNKDILAYGNQMRKTRNTELYDGGSMMITGKQSVEYLNFTEKLFDSSREIFKKYLGTLF